MKEIIETLNKADKESTAYPYWIIIDPRQNFEVGKQGLHNIAGMITGIFFSREDAEDFLQRTRYNFGDNAKVYCHSGHNSEKWRRFYEENNIS